ncbi:pyrroline-5-carboxylate reductase [Marivirga lumbricoides]|uniref:Pyrroline-5-carboxylate reductase n=1 Tax=Marivirga lumbricoides TaxID=1046115 RepID=A0ABQ1LKE8_9BACT|nr:pyrroline-5-carboxylate reductase [Marivirga lumbricoides]
MQHSIAIIGCGNLGLSIANGLIKTPGFDVSSLTLTKRKTESLSPLKKLGVAISSDNLAAAESADIIILAVKPFNLTEVLEEIKPAIGGKKQTIVSVATGVKIQQISGILGDDIPIFRAMPNIAADINESVTCICGINASEATEAAVKEIFNSIGLSITINEDLMEAATVLGACGIAYVLRFMRAMIQGGIQIGFDAKTASDIVNQTVKGAAEMMIQQPIHPEAAIDKVTTPKGCTIVGLNEMEHHGFSAAMVKGVIASFEKITL